MKVLGKLWKKAGGNVSMLVAYSLPILALAGGGTLDYVRATNQKTRIQNSIDNAVLGAVASVNANDYRSAADYEKALTKKIAYWLRANLDMKNLAVSSDGSSIRGGTKGSLKLTAIKVATNEKTGTVDVSVRAMHKTTFLNLIGIRVLDVSSSTQVKRSYNEEAATEIVLALDVTGSMSGSKLSELKRAANGFIDSLKAEMTKTKNRVKFKVGIVPFSQYVNVGTQYRNALWIDVPPNRYIQRRSCGFRCWSTCARYRYKRRCWWTGGGDWGVRRRICRNIRYCVSYKRRCGRRCYTYTRNVYWQGCVGSRNYPYNTTDSAYNLYKVPGVMNYTRDNRRWNYCPSRPVTPLKSLESNGNVWALKRDINRLYASGSTYIPAGLSWGARLLSPQAPFGQGASYADVKDKNIRKVLVLMTDGVNTVSPTYPDHAGYSRSIADSLTRRLCKKITANNPVTGKPYADIITVTFDVRDSGVKDMLKKCATLGSFDAGRGGLNEVFKSIGKKLAKLHLSR